MRVWGRWIHLVAEEEQEQEEEEEGVTEPNFI